MAYTLDHAFQLIQSAHERGRLAHAFLVTGSTSETRERLASKMIGMLEDQDAGLGGMDLFGDAPEMIEKDLDERVGGFVRLVRPQSKSRRIKVDDMRELERTFYQASDAGVWKVGVVIDADRMNPEAANAFLKTLEEPPKDSLLLLLTGQPERLLPTILSRCVQVPLMAESGKVSATLPEWAIETIEKIVKCLPNGFGNVADAMGAKGVFSGILAQRKEDVSGRYAAELKEEVARYKKAVEGDWLKRREEFFKALTESDYLEERSALIAGLVTWMGDVARIKAGRDQVDFESLAELSKQAAESDSLDGILRRHEAIEELRRIMETNAMEGLALDVSFTRAFG